MRFIVLSLFLLSLFLCLSSLSVNGQYAGVFLDSSSKSVAASLKQTTSPYDVLNNFPDLSYRRTQAHHLTIEFKPNPATKYQSFYQDVHHLKVLAYAHDSHGQAVLVHLEDNPCATQGGIAIANEWPHVTITDSTVAPYTAVYSNDLIGRLIHSKIIRVKETDSYGKPTKVGLWNTTIAENEWYGIAPAFTANATATTPVQNYPETPAYVKIFPQYGRNVLRLTGTVCINTSWNDTAVKCQAPKVTN